MERKIYPYTMESERSLVYTGTFLEGDDVEINEGDEILVFHTCKFCNVNILQKVERKIVAYYFQNKPIYDYKVENGGSYKCATKHISKYDQIKSHCSMGK